jgi:AcrR family transcriptional regulator
VDQGGLRERKKARTRADIQHHAMRLFREQGFETTTVDQIAEAAEVSQATFFRHFATKDDAILANDYDDRVIALFLAQPANRTPAQAMRAAIREVAQQMTPVELEEYEARQTLILGAPSLRAAAAWKAVSVTMPMIARAVAQRAGRDPDDLAVQAIAGALTGVTIAGTFHMAQHPEEDVTAWIDRALALLEDGLPLS